MHLDVFCYVILILSSQSVTETAVFTLPTGHEFEGCVLCVVGRSVRVKLYVAPLVV
jgi:hypothetical protein